MRLLERRNESLRLKDIHFSKRQVDRFVDAIHKPYGFILVTGPTGSGKTAMAQVMLGFMLLDEGLVSIDGELLTPLSAPTFRKTMAYLPQKHSVSLSPVEVNTMGLETIWSPFNNRNYHPSVIDEHLDVAPMASKAIIIADDPPSSLLSVLKSMATGNHTVIVMSCEENYINLSDKLITIGE
jgi:ABC-type cobalamin/Fe3+-siderophores transport system ATPase subunit